MFNKENKKPMAADNSLGGSNRIIAGTIIKDLKLRMTRAGLTNIHPERINSEHDSRIARLTGKADRVLVDAPC